MWLRIDFSGVCWEHGSKTYCLVMHKEVSFISLAIFMSSTPVLFAFYPFSLHMFVREAGCLYTFCFFPLFPITVEVFFTYYNSGICLGSHIGDRNVLSLLRYMACFGGRIFETETNKGSIRKYYASCFHSIFSFFL